MVEHFPVIVQHEPLVWFSAWEGFVKSATVFSDRYAEGSEAFLTGSV
jgi:hypothetical protein